MSFSLAERQAGMDPNDLGFEPIVVSAQLIRKSGGTYRVKVKGSRWRIRSDFPVQILADNQSLGIGGPLTHLDPVTGAIIPWAPGGMSFTLERNVTQFEFRLYGGTGGNLDIETYKAHGVCVIEGAPGAQLMPAETVPDLLPVHAYELAVPITGGVAGEVTGNFQLASFQFAGLSRTPKEFWVKSLGVVRTVDAGGALSASAVQRIDVRKNDNPVGDGTSLLVGCANAAAWSTPIANAKLPLYALLQQYGVETPSIQLALRVAADALATTARVHLTGAYKL